MERGIKVNLTDVLEAMKTADQEEVLCLEDFLSDGIKEVTICPFLMALYDDLK